jgi:hypothetical protein
MKDDEVVEVAKQVVDFDLFGFIARRFYLDFRQIVCVEFVPVQRSKTAFTKRSSCSLLNRKRLSIFGLIWAYPVEKM